MQLPTRLFGKQQQIIDVHVHTFFEQPDAREIARGNGAEFTLEGLRKECMANNVQSVCSLYNNFDQPLDSKTIAEQKQSFQSIVGVGIIHPLKLKKDSLAKTEKAIADGTFKALKVYPGYYPVFSIDKRFHPFYKLAGKYNIPVYVHAGDTLSSEARLKYCRPLDVDEVAVDLPDTNFIITQMGNPWFIDAAEVTYKNPNVYLDTAGLFAGMVSFSKLYSSRIQYVIDYIEDPRKILYGSDWPMVRMKEYIEFIKSIVPKQMHQKVFYDNAKRLFKL
jgi:predicted TIM-barrel fold metal-dependent hydrolase